MFTADIIYKFLIMKNLKNLGKSLSKNEQKMINGAYLPASCLSNSVQLCSNSDNQLNTGCSAGEVCINNACICTHLI